LTATILQAELLRLHPISYREKVPVRPPPSSPPQNSQGHQPGWLAVARGTALGIALLLTLNLLEVLHHGASSTDNWFCSLQPLPESVSRVLLAMAVPSYLLYAIRRAIPGPIRSALLLISALFLAATARDFQTAFHTLPEAVRISGSARHISVLLTLLVAGVGLLSTSRLRTAGAAPAGPLLFAAIVTVGSFPLACVVTDGTPRPLPSLPCLCVLRPPTDSQAATTGPVSLAATAARIHKELPQARFMVVASGASDLAGQGPNPLSEALIATGIPPKSLLSLSADSDELLAAALRQHPVLQPPNPRQLAFIAPADELARLNLLARRHGLKPLLIPAADAQAAPITRLREAWQLLRAMAAPAADYFRSLRAPAETQRDFTPATDDAVDPQQLIKELQDAAAADP